MLSLESHTSENNRPHSFAESASDEKKVRRKTPHWWRKPQPRLAKINFCFNIWAVATVIGLAIVIVGIKWIAPSNFRGFFFILCWIWTVDSTVRIIGIHLNEWSRWRFKAIHSTHMCMACAGQWPLNSRPSGEASENLENQTASSGDSKLPSLCWKL